MTALSLAEESKERWSDALGHDRMQMTADEISEVEVQRWMSVKPGSKKFSSCRRRGCGTRCRGQKMDAQ